MYLVHSIAMRLTLQAQERRRTYWHVRERRAANGEGGINLCGLSSETVRCPLPNSVREIR
jgi:hypothetical protein